MNDERLIDTRYPVTVCKASAGTGKTYTLAAYYIGLLLSGEDYRSILAITFTNKATAEMSERILTYLYAISRGGESEFLAYAKKFMAKGEGVEAKGDEQLRQRAGECFKAMLADYDNVQIQTIDSFLQTLLSGMAGLLHEGAGQNTELDVEQVIERAVDELMANGEGLEAKGVNELTNEGVKDIIREFVEARVADESSWDVRKNLCDLAKEMYNETVQVLDGRGEICFDADAIAARRERLIQRWETNEVREQVRVLLSRLEGYDIDESYGKQPAKDLVGLIKNTRDSLDRPSKTDKEYLFRGLSNSAYEKAQAGKWGQVPDEVREIAVQLTEASRACRKEYYTIQLSIELSHEMQLMSALQAIILRQLNEANSSLLARTASILSAALKSGDADFILEKAGIRYKHVLMDEFQDTSKMQWGVIEQLLRDVLAGAGHTLLIVGDIKQSIYRWRNGDWHIMSGLTAKGERLTEGRINEKFTSLKKNFRSSEEVVRFNLGLFKYITVSGERLEVSGDLVRQIYDEGYDEKKIEEYYQGKKKQGGFVRFKAIAKKNEAGEKVDVQAETISDMFDRMEELLARGASGSDMMVLIRKGSQAAPITAAHAALDPERYPHLSAVPMVSAQSFLLESSESVKLVISGLRVVAQRDELAARHIEMELRRTDVIEQIREKISMRTPLYEAVCELVKILLTDEQGQYCDRETAYVNCLLDRTREYVHTYGSNIGAFLEYWDEKMHEKSILVSSLGAIQIMTIHKSKGLQAQTLFVPFCTWRKDDSKVSQKLWCPIAEELNEGNDYIPLYNSEALTHTAYAPVYEDEHFNARIDSLNMLYVALTRAEDNLYIYTEYTPDTKNKTHVGYYVLDFLQSPDVSIGEPIVKKAKGERLEAKGDINKPFSFEGTQKQEAELWANSENVRFVQSQEGAMYTEYGEEAYRRVTRIEEGTLCHDIFAHLCKADELDGVLDDFESQGLIRDRQLKEDLRVLISSAWQGNEQMRDWFTAPYELRLEEPIYVNNHEVRPDRVMINPQTKEAIVLDYKFGHWEKEYITQVQGYMQALREMGYAPVRGYLWFARDNKLVKVNGDRL